MFDLDNIAPKVKALYTTFLNLSQAEWDALQALITLNLDDAVSDAVAAAEAAEDAALAGGEQPPIAAGIVGPATTNAGLVGVSLSNLPYIGPELTAACSTFDTWVDLVNYTGSGVLEHCTVYQNDNSSSRDAQVRVSIDGADAYISATTLFQSPSDDDKGVSIVGHHNSDSLALGRVQFNTSLLIQAKKTENAAGTVNIGARVRYQKWS